MNTLFYCSFFFFFFSFKYHLAFHVNDLLFFKLVTDTIYVFVCVCVHMYQVNVSAKCKFYPLLSQILVPSVNLYITFLIFFSFIFSLLVWLLENCVKKKKRGRLFLHKRRDSYISRLKNKLNVQVHIVDKPKDQYSPT